MSFNVGDKVYRVETKANGTPVIVTRLFSYELFDSYASYRPTAAKAWKRYLSILFCEANNAAIKYRETRAMPMPEVEEG